MSKKRQKSRGGLTLRTLKTFPASETDQLLLKIVRLDFPEITDPIILVDLCTKWQNKWRRSVDYWTETLKVSCERLGVSVPKDLKPPLVPKNMLPEESEICDLEKKIVSKRTDVTIISKRNITWKNKKKTGNINNNKRIGHEKDIVNNNNTNISTKNKNKANSNKKNIAANINTAISNSKNKSRSKKRKTPGTIGTHNNNNDNGKNNNKKKRKVSTKKNSNSNRKSPTACHLCNSDDNVNLSCKTCGKHFHSECVGRIVGLIHNVDDWACVACAPENELNLGTCFICGKGGSLLCCENCPRSFHKKCCGVECGLEDFSKTKTRKKSSNNIKNDGDERKQVDWCKLCLATCPVDNRNGNVIDIFSITTSMRYESERNLIDEKLQVGDNIVNVIEILRHLELTCSSHFFEELFNEYYDIFKDKKKDNGKCSTKMMYKFSSMIGFKEFLQILKFLNDNGTEYANGFSLMGGRGHGWQMCINCNKFRCLRTKCIHCGANYRKDVVTPSNQNGCEKYLFIPTMPKQTKVLINVLIPTRDKSTFVTEKKKSIGRALDRLMGVTMEKIEAATRTKEPTNITDLGSIVFLHYQAYVNLNDTNLIRKAKQNFIKAATLWLESSVIFLREEDEQFVEDHEISVARIAAVLLDCTQGLCALRWAMTANVISPCSKHGDACPFRTLSISESSRPYEYAHVEAKEASKCPYERALQLEYNLSIIDEGELYNDSTTWEYSDRYPITQKGHCMRCDKKYGRVPTNFICCDDKPLLRTIDYSTCYDYLIWGYCTQVIGIDAFKFDLSRFVRKLPVIRSYGTFEELGHRIYLHQCYFITHFIYVMSDWGRHRLCLNKFWEEFAFIVDNMRIVASHIKDFEVLGEFLNCLGIIGVAEEGEEAIKELIQYGQACLLQAERIRFKRSGQWVSSKRALKDQFHSSWCGLVGMVDYAPRAVGIAQRKKTQPLRIPPYFLGLNASVSLLGLKKKVGEDGTPIKYELRHHLDAEYAFRTLIKSPGYYNGNWPEESQRVEHIGMMQSSNGSSNSSNGLIQDVDNISVVSDTSSMNQFEGINSRFMMLNRRTNSSGSAISNGSSLRLLGNGNNNSNNGSNDNSIHHGISSIAEEDIIDNNDDDGIDNMGHRIGSNDVESDNEVSEDSMTMMNTIGNGDVDDDGDHDENDDDEDHIIELADTDGFIDGKQPSSSSATTIRTASTTGKPKVDNDGEVSPSNSSKSSTSYCSSSDDE